MLKFNGINKEKEIYLPNKEYIIDTDEKVNLPKAKYICILLLSKKPTGFLVKIVTFICFNVSNWGQGK